MNIITERRRSVRMPAAYPAVIYHRRGKMLSRGRTANISETGVLVILSLRRPLPLETQVILELSIPSARADSRDEFRRVVYVCRVAREFAVGQLSGIGLEFVKKLA